MLYGVGFWLGEGASPLWRAGPVLAGLIGVSVVVRLLRGAVWIRVLGGLVALTMYSVAILLGSRSFDRAFTECLERGEEVRIQLQHYYDRNARYPERLNALEGPKLCERFLRSSILDYQRISGGYRLSFRDWLVEHAATEAEPFMARK